MTAKLMRLRDLGMLMLIAGGAVTTAAQSGFSRVVLQDHSLSVEGRHGVSARADFEPGGSSGMHAHPGEEFGYVIEGRVALIVAGRPNVVLNDGDVFFIPSGVPHDGRNVGTQKAAILSVFVAEEGKPIATPLSPPAAAPN